MELNSVFIPSEKIVCRDIMGRMIIVPIESGIADLENAMFSFNETGALVWKCIEKKKTVDEICLAVEAEYDSDMEQITAGVKDLLTTLLEKKIIRCNSPGSGMP